MVSFIRLYFSMCLIVMGAAAQSLVVTSANVIGTGCPPNRSLVEFDQANQKIKVHVEGLKAQAGPGISFSQGRKNCRLTLSVKVPAGYSLGIDSTNARVSYSADRGVTLSSTSVAYVQGQINDGQGSTTLSGPASRNGATITNDLSPNVWTACGQATVLNIGTDLQVSNGANKRGSGTISVSGPWEARYIWKKC